jgi:excinuclease UvrABC ATPase subunit
MSLSRIISPLFQIPDVIFTSEFKTSEKIGGKSTKSYTVRGWWCDSCLNYYLAPTADTLSKYTQEGSATNMHGAPHLADIEIAPQVSVGELLTLNAANGRRQLQLPQPLAQCYDLMIRVGAGLEGISLGQAVATLSGYELAKLTIVKALLNYRHQESLATLIKLPKGVFSERHEERLREVLEEHASTLRYTDNLFSESSAKPTDSRTIILKGPTSNPQRSEDVSVTLFSSVEERLRGSVVGHTLGILEPLAELFAASINARAQGLKKRDFILFGSRNPPFRCDGCNGLGVVITHDDAIKYPQINCCTECAGARCKGPITIVAFRGMALPDILNAPIKNSAAVLSALPRIKGVLELLGKLNLDHLALGAPCELLSCEEFRLLMIAKELAKLKLKGGELILTIEGMSCGFSNQQLAGLREALHDFGGVF